MRNEHIIRKNIEIKCPWEDCGKTFFKTVTLYFVTNQRGDVIDSKVI